MFKQLLVQNQDQNNPGWHYLNVSNWPDPEPPQKPVVQLSAQKSHHGHPLLIAGILIGVLFGLIAFLPPKVRGFVVLAILAGIVWLFWSANHDRQTAQAYTGTQQPVASDYAPRAELVQPSHTIEVRRAQLVRLPNK